MEFPSFSFNKKNDRRDDRVHYIDGSALLRPIEMPWAFRAIVAIFVVVGAVIGGIILINAYDTMMLAPQREVENTQKNLAREVPLQLPLLTSLIQLDDASIKAALDAADYLWYDMNTIGGTVEGGGIDAMKLPEGVSLVDAALAYSKGISRLSSSDAARYLNGSWRYTVGRGGYVDMKVKYADFRSGSIEAAIQNAIVQEGLGETERGESGIDNAGNTYQTGTVNVNGVIYSWQVSACPLSEVYGIEGLPEDAVYVGIRMYLY